VRSLGKFRHLSRCTTAAGHFVILAIDHRANLRQALEQDHPIEDGEFRDFKLAVVEAAASLVSAVLGDPAYTLGAVVARRTFTGGLLSPLEVTDYDLHPSQRPLNWIPGWSAAKIKRMGGDGVKLLLPYHPDLPDAEQKTQSVAQLIRECQQLDLPLYLEPIACSLRPGERLSSVEQRRLTVQMAQAFSNQGADVLKLQLPAHQPEWEPTCEQLAQSCSSPWALLSGGVDFETFCRQAELACEAGASGVIVGRAVWSEATALQGTERRRFLQNQVKERLHRLADICAQKARPFYSKGIPEEPATDWFESYPSLF
jgi:tagatose 1,6-diphosphate aldolase